MNSLRSQYPPFRLETALKPSFIVSELLRTALTTFTAFGIWQLPTFHERAVARDCPAMGCSFPILTPTSSS